MPDNLRTTILDFLRSIIDENMQETDTVKILKKKI
jgi:hypothetical protein